MLFIITRLYHFTLSHFGSQTPLSTLKPNVTTLAPRLSTGCWLDFTGLGLSPNYILHAELAHPHTHYTVIRLFLQFSFGHIFVFHSVIFRIFIRSFFILLFYNTTIPTYIGFKFELRRSMILSSLLFLASSQISFVPSAFTFLAFLL